jgi:hypothetical protein
VLLLELYLCITPALLVLLLVVLLVLSLELSLELHLSFTCAVLELYLSFTCAVLVLCLWCTRVLSLLLLLVSTKKFIPGDDLGQTFALFFTSLAKKTVSACQATQDMHKIIAKDTLQMLTHTRWMSQYLFLPHTSRGNVSP